MPERTEMLHQNGQLLKAMILMLVATILLLVFCLIVIVQRTPASPETGREILCRHALAETPVDPAVVNLCHDVLQP